MTRPRLSISGLMALVVLAGLDFGALRLFEDGVTSRDGALAAWRQVGCLGLLTGTPMASLLAVVAWRSRPRPGPRASAFLVVGGAMLAASIALGALIPETLMDLAERLYEALDRALARGHAEELGLFEVLVVLVSIPPTLAQVLPALAAARWHGRYEIQVRRRPIDAATACDDGGRPDA